MYNQVRSSIFVIIYTYYTYCTYSIYSTYYTYVQVLHIHIIQITHIIYVLSRMYYIIDMLYIRDLLGCNMCVSGLQAALGSRAIHQVIMASPNAARSQPFPTAFVKNGPSLCA